MKKRRLSKKGKILFLTIIFIIIIVFSYLYFIDHSIKGIFIENNNIVSDDEIIKQASLEDYPNFYLTTSYSIKKKLLKNPYIKDVKITKKFYHEIHIFIEEHKPLFINQETNKIILENGQSITNDDKLSLPVLINHVEQEEYANFINKISRIDNLIINKISEIKYDPTTLDEDRFLLYMNDQNYVYITLTKIELLNKYDEAVTKLNGKKGILYLDSGNYFEIK